MQLSSNQTKFIILSLVFLAILGIIFAIFTGVKSDYEDSAMDKVARVYLTNIDKELVLLKDMTPYLLNYEKEKKFIEEKTIDVNVPTLIEYEGEEYFTVNKDGDYYVEISIFDKMILTESLEFESFDNRDFFSLYYKDVSESFTTKKLLLISLGSAFAALLMLSIVFIWVED